MYIVHIDFHLICLWMYNVAYHLGVRVNQSYRYKDLNTTNLKEIQNIGTIFGMKSIKIL